MSEQNVEEQLKKQESQILDVAKAVAGHHVLLDKVGNINDNLMEIVKLQQRLDKISTRLDDVQTKTTRVGNHILLYLVVMIILSTVCFCVAIIW